MKHSSASKSGFTLIELILVISIIALLATLLSPALQTVMQNARSTACAANLRQIGVAALLSAQDNDNRFPKIETDPQNPVYPDDPDAKPIGVALGKYGITETNLKCPGDLAGPDYFAKRGTSYEWRPMMDGELVTNPIYYSRFGNIPVPPSRVRLVIDITPVHSARSNRLYADGHVQSF